MKSVCLVLVSVLLLGWLPAAGATRRALVFGLGAQEDTRWGKIHGDNDVGYVVQMLREMGYTDIRTLKNEHATKQAMVDAFTALAMRCEKGDKVYVHYSGHGQLMTDLDGDEAVKWTGRHAAWDEAWIPYDAYLTYGPEDRGEKHLCDDEVAQYLQRIRQRIGRRGELVVVVDACHSGDATTGAEEECVRGIDMKFEVPRTTQQTAVAQPTEEQWLTISACKPYQLCTELKDKKVGKLTYALYVMRSDIFKKSNAEMEEALALFMAKNRGRLPQTPVISGKR